MKDLARQRLMESSQLKERCAREYDEQIARVAGELIACYREGGKVLLFGNGGSAADAQHLAAELVGRFKLERTPLPAIALTTDTSILTAVGNDYGFDQVFTKQVEALAREGDVVIAITTSGNSPNVIAAAEKAKSLGAKVIGLTGVSGGLLAGIADKTLQVPSDDTPRIQELHITIGHIICELVERELFTRK